MRRLLEKSDDIRRQLFALTADQMQITPQAVEKDYWVCLVLDALFRDPELCALLRFKGGTSLSKCHNAINRFSEDIDLVLDWSPFTDKNPSTFDTVSKRDRFTKNSAEKLDHMPLNALSLQ